MNKLKPLLILLLGLLIPASAQCGPEHPPLPVEKFTLDNGMTFLVVERPTAPVFSGFIVVGAGSAYERRGEVGSAHLLEHMMFKGSENVGTSNFEKEAELMAKEDSVWALIDEARQKTRFISLNNPEELDVHLDYIARLETVLDSLVELSSQYVIQNEFDRIYTTNGAAQFNAVTGYDFTRYFVSLPSNRLELWFAMESDRLKNLALREFFPERDVVSEERRLSVENSAGAKLFEQFIGTAFIAHPYQLFWEWQSEENNLTRDDLWNFFNTYYIPSRMTAAVIGDVKLDQVKELAEKYFGGLKPAEEPEPIYTEEPPQPGERRVDVYFDAEAMVSIGYHKPAFDSPDEPVFNIIERILGEGRTSRLYKSLVLEKQIALDIDVYTFPGATLGDLHEGLFCIDAYPKEGVTMEELETAIYEELDKLGTELVSEKELQKIKNNIEASFIWASYSNLGLASYLSMAENLAGNWKFITTMQDRLNAVTSKDILNAAQKYFTEQNRTVAVLIPKEEGAAQ